MRVVTGIAGSRGYGCGNAVVKTKPGLEITRIDIANPEAEIAKFRAAQDAYDARLSQVADDAERQLGKDAAAIFLAYRQIVRDEHFFRGALSRVETERINAEFAVFDECRNLLRHFVSMDDTYMSERAFDIQNVCDELIKTMMGVNDDFSSKMADFSDAILVSDDLTPSETIKLDKSVLRGIVTEHGGATSHTVILAKALGIPAIVGAAGATGVIRDGDFLQMDAFLGEIDVEPDDRSRRAFDRLKKDFDRRLRLLSKDARQPAVTKDGFTVKVTVNTGDLASIAAFDPRYSDGVGLMRTEFIYLNAPDYPTEEEQFRVYKDLAVRARGKPVVIRTLDVGGDRQADYMNMPKERNPFLGYRAIRVCLDRRDVFSAQLRAILRASAFGDVRVMFPMIVTLEELFEAKTCLEAEKTALTREGIAFNQDIPVGSMIETPSAVLLSEKIIKACDFVSIGSNDLIQYITASDRLNEYVSGLYESCNVAVLRAVHMVAGNAAKEGVPWSICGEVAGEERLAPLWVAFGVSGLSVSPLLVGEIKNLICRLSRGGLQELASAALECDSAADVKTLMDGFLKSLGR